ncbi:RH31 [Symbiodinium sp. CCMP2592]|nr:RH31 [Symbiodinium sp. CCMP2592]
MAQFFREQLRMGVYEIHRRRDADARIATQERFKEAQSGILFSSDVSARGMDYPNVTLVLQFGAPATREMYIHRVGRTARAGKSGQAVLILGELESSFLTAVQDLPIRQHERAEELKRVNELLIKATTSWLASAPLRAAASAAFASLLVHYKATHRILHMEDDAVIQAASDLLLGCGLVDQPVISRRLGVMLGLEKNPLIQCARRIGEQDDVLQAGMYMLTSSLISSTAELHRVDLSAAPVSGARASRSRWPLERVKRAHPYASFLVID